MRKWFQYWAPPLSIAIALAIAVAYFTRKPRSAIWNVEGAVKSSENSGEQWKYGTFISTASTRGTRALVDKIRLDRHSAQVTDAAVDRLKEAVTDLLEAYINGDFAAYRRFRLPTQEGKWNSEFLTFYRGFLRSRFPEWKDTDRAPFDEIFKLYFHCSLMRSGVNKSRTKVELDKSRYSMGFIDKINLEACSVHIETLTKPKPPLQTHIVAFENAGFFISSAVFDFDTKPVDAIRATGRVSYATVKLLLKTKDDAPVPHFLRLFWADRTQTWLPIEYGIPHTAKHNTFAF